MPLAGPPSEKLAGQGWHGCEATYQSFRRTYSFVDSSDGLVSWDDARCSPRDWARRQVSASRAHDPSAFMSFKRTKLVINKAWMESRLGLSQR